MKIPTTFPALELSGSPVDLQRLRSVMESVRQMFVRIAHVVNSITQQVFADTRTAPQTVTLQDPMLLGTTVLVKDQYGNAGTHNITVVGTNIDGAGSFIINGNFNAFSFVWNGSGWSVV